MTDQQPQPEQLKPKELSPEEVIAQEVDTFLKEKNVKLTPVMSFPIYNQYPPELRLALQVIQRHEPKWDIDITIQKNSKPETLPNS